MRSSWQSLSPGHAASQPSNISSKRTAHSGRRLTQALAPMTGTVLRATGSAKAVRTFLASTHWQPCATYFRGEPRGILSTRKHIASGFNLSISNASGTNLSAQVRAALKFLGKEYDELARLSSLGLTGALDFGVTSGVEAAASFYRFPAELVASLATASLSLEVSYYGPQGR